MTCDSNSNRTLPIKLMASLAILVTVMFGANAARADHWDHYGYHHHHHDRYYGGGYYRDGYYPDGYYYDGYPPPVVYGSPYYAPPPPVVYGPSVGVVLPGISIGIH